MIIYKLSNQQMISKGKGKIYLLIGYLGSGKTTFIRNLLMNKQGEKYAVIQNEFAEGQMGIEQPLIMDESGVPFSSFLQLPNGCICCSAKNDLVAGVQYILNNTDVQNIIVETNGLADPAQAIKQFWFDDKLQMNAQLHSIIAIISIPKFITLQQETLLKKQIIFANKVLLTFIDKSTEDQTKQVQSAIRDYNQQCQIKKSDSYDIVQFLSGENMFHLQNLLKQSNEQDKKHLHKDIRSICLKGHTEHKNKNQFECGVGQLLWQSGMNILRIKGIVSLPDNQNVYQLQGVDDIFEIKQSKTKKEKVKDQTIILIIGQKIKQIEARQILKIK